MVSAHGYKDGELDSVDDGEIAAAWIETAHELAPPLEFQVHFANAESVALEFTKRLRILDARSPLGNPIAADRIEGDPAMLFRVCQSGCAPYLVRTLVSCSPTTFAQLRASRHSVRRWTPPKYAGVPPSLQMLREVERWLKEHHATTLDELDARRGRGELIERDASVQAVVKVARTRRRLDLPGERRAESSWMGRATRRTAVGFHGQYEGTRVDVALA